MVSFRKSPPPACPQHPGSSVIRYGTYGISTGKPRQRYQCRPADGSKPHVFTPLLPRSHVHAGEEHCDHCDEMRGVHRGETAVARRHTWDTRTVAEGLSRLSAGASYGDVGRWARRVRGTTRTRPAPASKNTNTKGKTNPAGDASRNAWHIAADWVEAFGPVIYEPIDTELRQRAFEERERLDEQWENGEVLQRPQVWLLDDVPVYGRDLDSRVRRRDAGFFVLVIAELDWTTTDAGGPTARLRLVRAMAKSSTAAWRVCFDELGYAPDFVVADAGTGLTAAVATHFKGTNTPFVPSLWHLKNRIGAGLRKSEGSAHPHPTRQGTHRSHPVRTRPSPAWQRRA